MSRQTHELIVVAAATAADDEIKCDECKSPAEIFQVTGNYCINCWQAVTHSNV